MSLGAARRPAEHVAHFPRSFLGASSQDPIHPGTSPSRAEYAALLQYKIPIAVPQLTVSNRMTRVMICAVVGQLVLTDEGSRGVRGTRMAYSEGLAGGLSRSFPCIP
jgi:hypothetical protein